MGWMNLNDVLRQDTEEEADWAAKHAPNLSKVPRGWRPVAFIPTEEAVQREDEALKDAIVRLKRFSPTAVAMALDCSESRVNQVFKEERDRIGVVQAG